MRRWGLPIVAILLLVAIVLVSLRLGYLGRVEGGPLKEAGVPDGIGLGTVDRPRRRVHVFRGPLQIDGGPVRITSSRPVLASPGLQVLGPRVDRAGGGGPTRTRRWPARTDLGPFVGVRVTDRSRDGIALGLRARRPGTYYVFGLETDYERGARSFRHVSGGTLCLAVRRACDLSTDPPDPDLALVDIGGPSDYGVKLRADAADDRDVASYPARDGTATIELTLTNQSDEPIAVRDVSLGVTDPDFDVSATTTPSRFSLAPGRGRGIRLDLRLTGCAGGGSGAASIVDALQARVDGERVDVPLLTELEFASPARC